MQVTDEIVEAAAKKLYEMRHLTRWESLGERSQDIYRVEARAMLRIRSALVDVPVEPVARKFELHDRVQKHSGAWWEGKVVGFYSTNQTPLGYCVQLDTVENGPVQIYPESALELAGPTSPPLSREGEDSAEVIPAGLVERCAEILEWKKTGKLPGNALRELGQSIANRLGGSLFIDNGLNQAELATVDEALKLILALAATRSGSASDGGDHG